MRDLLVDKFGANVTLQKGSGGIFNISVDGELKFSNQDTGQFPTDQELDALGA